MIKRLIFNALVCVMILSFASCGLINTKNPSQGSPGKSDDSGNGSYPRIKYYDGKQGYEWAAALQNARISYTYGEDRSDGNGGPGCEHEDGGGIYRGQRCGGFTDQNRMGAGRWMVCRGGGHRICF